ncbi:MAG: hypothetical protein ACRCUX_10280, partial [Beijerinckiaceae bacterium]
PIDLVRLNFGTTDLAEVNWYLKNYVGCTQTTSDGKNYTFGSLKFSQTNPTKAVIFVPRPTIDAGEIIIGGPGGGAVEEPKTPKAFKDVLATAYEFEIKLAEKPLPPHAYVQGKWNVALKVKFQFLESNNKFSAGGSKDAVAAAFERKLTDTVSVQLGEKVKLEDVKKKGLLKAIQDGFEAAIKFQFPIGENFKFGVSPALKLKTTPFVLKLSGDGFGVWDFGPELLGPGQSLKIAFGLQVQGGVEVGPTPYLIAQVGEAVAGAGGAGVILQGAAVAGLPIVAFIGFGAYYGTIAGRRGDAIGLMSWYVNSYMYNCGFRDSASFPTNAEERRMVDEGRADVQRDMARLFPGYSFRDQVFMWMTLWILAAGKQPGTQDAFNAGRQRLDDFIWAEAKKKFRFDAI